MKICPKCKSDFKRMKKGGCPNCGVKLFYDSTKKARLEQDKDTVTAILRVINQHIQRNSKVMVDLTNDNVERKFAYVFLDRTRVFLDNQTQDFSAKQFAVELLKEILNDSWWAGMVNAKNIPNMPKLANQVSKFAPPLYQRLYREQVKATAQQERLNSMRMLDVSFGI